MRRTLLTCVLALTGATLLAQATNYPDGSTVDDFTVTDIEGNTYSLYEITAQGKYVVLDFFFTTCGPCRQTAPYFNQLHETYGCNEHDLFCLTINNGMDSTAEVAAYEDAFGGSYHHSPAVSNEGNGGAVSDAFGVEAFPTYCMIGPDNVMLVHDMWPIGSMSDLVDFFPADTDIQPAACVTAVAEIANVRSFAVQPSLSNGPITIELKGQAAGPAIFEVFNLVGQPVHTARFTVPAGGAAHRDLDLSALAEGQYLCSLTLANGSRSVQRVVIAR